MLASILAFPPPWPPRVSDYTLSELFTGEDVEGRAVVRLVRLTGDTSYPIGGYIVPPVRLGMSRITLVDFQGDEAASGAYNYVWDPTTGSWRIFVGSSGLELLGGNDASSISTIAFIVGTQ